jgi:glycosyltransferase involved in cell wall biosynthesis
LPEKSTGSGTRPERVSIVIPTYNHGRFLAQAIDSVLGQRYPDVELIVLDDGSTDETSDVIGRYSGRLRAERQPRMGQAATLNKGWAMSTGAILGYLSADDYLDPDAVGRAVEALQGSPHAVVAYGGFDIVDDAGQMVDAPRAQPFDYDAMVRNGLCPLGPGAFFRRTVLEAVAGWDERLRLVPDFDFWLRVGLHGEFRCLPEVLGHYRAHDRSQTYSRVAPAQADEIISVLDRLFSEARLPARLQGDRRRSLASAHLVSARFHFYAARYRVGLRRTATAIALNPGALATPRAYRLIASGLMRRGGQRLVWRLRRRLRPAR